MHPSRPQLSRLLEPLCRFIVDDESTLGVPLRRLGGFLFAFVRPVRPATVTVEL
jgi:hypothetical protein